MILIWICLLARTPFPSQPCLFRLTFSVMEAAQTLSCLDLCRTVLHPPFGRCSSPIAARAGNGWRGPSRAGLLCWCWGWWVRMLLKGVESHLSFHVPLNDWFGGEKVYRNRLWHILLMEEILQQLVGTVAYPIIYKVLYTLGVAGSPPATVSHIRSFCVHPFDLGKRSKHLTSLLLRLLLVYHPVQLFFCWSFDLVCLLYLGEGILLNC